MFEIYIITSASRLNHELGAANKKETFKVDIDRLIY